MKRNIVLLTAALFVSACSSDTPDPGASASPEAPPARSTRPPATLTPEDVEGARLTGELGCSFTTERGSQPVLVARADVLDTAHAQGLVKLGTSAVRLRSDGMGGFDALVHGASFTGGDLQVRVTVTSDRPAGEGESPPYPAELEMGSAGLAPQRVLGQWTCGP